MKRRALSLICCMALLLLGAGGCKKKTVAAFDGMTPAEIIDKIYANVSVELPMLATTDITAENMAYYLGVSDLAIEAGAASEPLVNAIPFSLCVLRISQKADSAGMQQTIRNSVNPKKCKNMYIPTVRERLQEAETLAFTCQLTRLDENQVHYVINFAEEHISAIK